MVKDTHAIFAVPKELNLGIGARLIQKVSLLRDQKLTSYAITWSTGGVGSIAKPILSQLRENVETMVDVFIKAYLAENPR